MYAGCVSGAVSRDTYLDAIRTSGFANITVQKERKIEIPDDILKRYLSDAELAALKQADVGVYSLTVYADKPADPHSAA